MYFSTSDRSRNSVCPLPVMEASLSITEEDRHTLRAPGWQERQKAYLALRVTLQALRDRLTVEEVAQLGQQFSGDDRIDPEQVARAVFTALAKRVSEGEIEDVKHVLPAEIRDLWP